MFLVCSENENLLAEEPINLVVSDTVEQAIKDYVAEYGTPRRNIMQVFELVNRELYRVDADVRMNRLEEIPPLEAAPATVTPGLVGARFNHMDFNIADDVQDAPGNAEQILAEWAFPRQAAQPEPQVEQAQQPEINHINHQWVNELARVRR